MRCSVMVRIFNRDLRKVLEGFRTPKNHLYRGYCIREGVIWKIH
jgi:hypothetical protein